MGLFVCTLSLFLTGRSKIPRQKNGLLSKTLDAFKTYLTMGAGVSISDNVSSAMAAASTEVLNQTNTSFDQSVGQVELIGLNNCDMFVGKDLNISQTSSLTAALSITANVTDTTNISNAIAQTLAQEAQSSVGTMAIGYAGASNVASSFASMNTNMANYVTQSAKQSTNNEQSFQCNNSTITVDGSFNLSQMETSSTSGDMSTTVTNSTDIANAITQSITQSASASTGLDMASFVIIVIVVVVGVVIFKIMETQARNKSTTDPKVQNCVMELSMREGGSKEGFMTAQASCPTCVDRCIQVSQASHLYIHLGWVFAWLAVLALIAITIGVWYGYVGTQGCLNNDSCSSTASSSWASGCSCDMETVLYNPTAECKSPVLETQSGVGLPIKYQYPLLHSMTSNSGTSTSSTVGAASLQGMVVASYKKGQTEYNSNNGNNLYTLLTYENLWNNGNTAVRIQTIFTAAATYIMNNGSYFANLYAVINNAYTDNLTERGHILFRYLNPLRLEFADTADTYLESPTTNSTSDVTSTKVYPVPAPYRYNREDITAGGGSCSITTMNYATIGGVAFTNEADTDSSFCENNATMQYPTDDDVWTFTNNTTNEAKSFSVDDLITLLNSEFNNVDQDYSFKSSDGSSFTPLDVYCRWADLAGNEESELVLADYGMMRLLYAGILSTQLNMAASPTMWGVNTLFTIPNYTTYDYAFAAGYVWNSITSSDDCYTTTNGPCSGLEQGNLPTSVIVVTAEDAVNQGSYEVTTGMTMATINASSALSGQGYTLSSKGMGYCRNQFLNENTLIMLWIVFAFWFLLFPGYVLIRAYVGESQSTATGREAELHTTRQQGEAASDSTSGNYTTQKKSTQYYLDTSAPNPFKACSKTGSGKAYPNVQACRVAFETK
mgnify:CR=1 FL=1